MNSLRSVLFMSFSIFVLYCVVAQSASTQGSEAKPAEGPVPSIKLIFRTHRILGVDVCMRGTPPRPYTCLKVENAWPVHLAVVRQPAIGPSSENNGATEEFREVDVYSWVFPYPLPHGLFAVPTGSSVPVPAYSSDADRFTWQSELVDLATQPQSLVPHMPLDLMNSFGVWGKKYPAAGHMVVPYGESLAAVRGIENATSIWSAHIRNPVDRYWPLTGHFLQSGGRDYRIGAPQPFAQDDNGKTRTFWHYGIFQACYPCWGARLAPARSFAGGM